MTTATSNSLNVVCMKTSIKRAESAGIANGGILMYFWFRLVLKQAKVLSFLRSNVLADDDHTVR